jgi:hypothetical protein
MVVGRRVTVSGSGQDVVISRSSVPRRVDTIGAVRDWERERDRLLKHAEGNYARSLKLMHSKDPQFSEDGFQLLSLIAADHIDELIEEYRRADTHTYWLLELIADARSPRAFDVLVEALDHEYDWYRSRAEGGLRALGTKEARRLLFERGLRTR